MLGSVQNRSVSPVFVGRARELTVLTEALARATAGEPQALLIGGEAGVGKTRLVTELLDTARAERAVVAAGGCVEVGADGLPFAPFSTALRSLRRGLPEELAAAADGQEGELARILPELGQERAGSFEEHGTARLFELTVRLLERLAADRTVVLVLEDLHWADASTRHLLAYLFRTLRRGRLVVIATYRADDVHRRHPLRPLLAELDRLRSVQRVELSRFSRAEVRHQLTGVLAAEPAPALLDEIFERSDGNAFFVEELACSFTAGRRAGLSDSLRDLLLVRVEALPEDAQRIARIVAEGGTAVEHRLLSAVARLSEDTLITALRAAVGANILVPTEDGDGYRFRHSLVREAVSDDLLPGERSRINRRYAEALEAGPTLVRADERTTRLASHWYHAHDAAKALPVVLRASVEARRRYAYSEQLRLLERAMELWDEAPEEVLARLRPPDDIEVRPPGGSDRTNPLCHADLLAEATVAARFGGAPERALALAKRATRGPEGRDDPLRAAWFWTQRSCLVQDLARGDGRLELDTAQELVRGLPPSGVHADILVNVAGWGALHRPGPEALVAADRAVRYAGLVGAEHTGLHARLVRGRLTAEAGGVEDGLAEMYEVRELAAAREAVEILGRVSVYLPSTLEGMGRSTEAVAAAERGVEICHRRGLADREACVRAHLALSLFSLGRWPEADAVLEEAAGVAHSRTARGLIALRRAELALARGDIEQAQSQLALIRGAFGPHDPQPQHVITPARLAMETAARQGRLAGARTEFQRVVADGFPPGAQRYALPLLRAAASMEADARGLPGADEGRERTLKAVRGQLKRLPTLVSVWGAYGLLCEAELARAEGEPAPALWARAVAAFEALGERPAEPSQGPTGQGRPFELASARYRWAAALLDVHAQRSGAAAPLVHAHRTAVGLGARLLAEDITLLAARARVSLTPENVTKATSSGAKPEPAADPATALGLTPRERDVLRLVATGHSNRRIAGELFISPKTASVHVSNILAKLGVSGRTEAAALAHRLRLFPERPGRPEASG
ncbi:AAA family ATPase [Streptomyces sp. NPDC088725]|uniref:helix-turn-helix transcriptional regulator n=1 Tax=Streptomyces sp. NPDC088725 TaxID=3365873 RepID=UPI0038014A85